MEEIRNRFKVLLAQKELIDKRKYTYDDISRETGLSPKTIASYSTNSVSRFDKGTLITLCNWFDCDLSELIQYPPVQSHKTRIHHAAVAA